MRFVVFGLPLAWILTRSKSKVVKIIDSLVDLSLVMPTAALGFSVYLYWGSKYGLAYLLGLENGLFSQGPMLIILLHVVFTLPYMIRSIAAAIVKIDLAYEQAAITLGAQPITVFRTIYLPLFKDGIIVGSPVYWGGVTAQLKAIFDRSMSVEIQGKSYRNKVGGAISVGYDRHGGQETTCLEIYLWMLIHDMIVVGPGPNVPVRGRGGLFCGAATQGFPYPTPTMEKGGRSAAMKDEIGLNSIRDVGKRVAELAKIVKAGFMEVPEENLAWPKKIKLDLFNHYKELKRKKQ